MLINVVFASLFIGETLPSRRMVWERAASQTAFGMVLGFGQYLVGGLVVLLVLRPLLGTDPLMACLIEEVGFEGGHGTAAGMGTAFRRLGLESGEALGLAMVTFGILAGVLVGSALVVIGGAIGLGVLLRHAMVRLAGALGGEESAELFAAVPLFPLAMDVLIAAAMASLNLPLVEEAWLPLLLLALAITAAALAFGARMARQRPAGAAP